MNEDEAVIQHRALRYAWRIVLKVTKQYPTATRPFLLARLREQYVLDAATGNVAALLTLRAFDDPGEETNIAAGL